MEYSSNQTEVRNGGGGLDFGEVTNATTTTTTASHDLQHPEWLRKFEEGCRIYMIPLLCGPGVLFNIVSVFVLLSSALHLKRSLVLLFSFLNISDW